eukprot:tig00021135_g18933.t1
MPPIELWGGGEAAVLAPRPCDPAGAIQHHEAVAAGAEIKPAQCFLNILWIHDPASTNMAFCEAARTLSRRGWGLDMAPSPSAALSRLLSSSTPYGACVVDWCDSDDAESRRIAVIQELSSRLGVVVFKPSEHYPTKAEREEFATLRETCLRAGASEVVQDEASLDTALGQAANVPSFILYAMPCGPLSEQLQAFQDEVLETFGRNRQHEYWPHCTLTGFFRTARPGALRPLLVESFLRTVEANPNLRRPELLFKVRENNVRMDLAQTEDLERFAGDFRERVRGHAAGVRVKGGLHVSMAHGFDPRHQAAIEALARERVDPAAEVRWELRLYERLGRDGWTVLAATDLA